MKSLWILDYDSGFEKKDASKGHYKDKERAKISNAIIDLAEDIQELNNKLRRLS